MTFDPDLPENRTVKLADSWLFRRAHHGLSDHVVNDFFEQLEIPENGVRSPRGQNDRLVTSENRPKNMVFGGF